ncbi:hypothetical protein BY458DRAFT_519105 [Sporodiniella umbellata]|nr:hypothetical protein BY458DRAFT_519105 [Sporodiniella umbellata]
MNQNTYFPTPTATPPGHTPLMTQDLSQVFSEWLMPSQDGLLKQEEFPDLFGLFSPPLTASPASDNEATMASCDFVTLFPDMAHANATPPKPVPVQTKRRFAPLMPKTSNVVPIAPRPGQFNAPVTQKRKVDDGDDATVKRQKNTDAARRSRLKKILKMETLEGHVKELESDNAKLNTRVAVLESEKGALASKEKSLEERIRVLETQLAEAHKALTTIRS